MFKKKSKRDLGKTYYWFTIVAAMRDKGIEAVKVAVCMDVNSDKWHKFKEKLEKLYKPATPRDTFHLEDKTGKIRKR